MVQQPSSTTILIITLVLNALSAPELACLVENSFEICGGDLGSSRHAGKHLPSFPPVVSFSGSGVVMANTTASSLLLLLVVCNGNQAVWHPASYTDVNGMIPWPSLQLGMYGGAPQTQTGELVPSYSFGLNKSLDGFFISYYATSLMLPKIQEPLNNYSCRLTALIMDSYSYSAYNDTAESFVEIGHHNNSRREASPSRRDRTRYRRRLRRVRPFATHRKLLSAHDSSTKRNLLPQRRRQVLFQEERAVRIRTATTGIAVGFALFGLLCATAGLVVWCMRKNSEDEKLVQQVELCPSGPRRYGRREVAAATGRFAEEGKIGRGGFGPVYRGFLADQERHDEAEAPEHRAAARLVRWSGRPHACV